MSIKPLLVMILIPACAASGAELAPGSSWRTAAPEEIGLDSAALVEMFDAVREKEIPVHSIQIVRHGRLALDAYFYPYNAEMRHDLASVTKSVTSTLVGLALEAGKLQNMTQTVLSFFPERVAANLDDRKRALDLEHLLTMQAGWDCGFEPHEARLMEMRRSADWIQFMLNLPMLAAPGTRWAYCSGNCHLLSAILKQVLGTDTLTFARRQLFDPLEITDVAWPADANGNNHGWGDLQMHPRDMAKLGQLFLQRGRWGDRRVIPESWIAVATRSHVERTSNKDGYGYFWWVKGDDYRTMFEAVGRGGQRINVWPAQQLVLVFTGGGFEPGDLAKFILRAIKSSDPLPANPDAARRLMERIGKAARAPEPLPISPVPQMAGRISGKVFRLSTNTIGLNALSLRFHGAAETEAEFVLEQQRLRFPVGLDGVGRFSPNPIVGLPQLARGEWSTEETFVLRLDLVGGINHYTLNLTFAQNGQDLKARLTERTGLHNEDFEGRATK